MSPNVYFVRIQFLAAAAGLLALSGLGCSPAVANKPPLAEESIRMPDGTPEELAAVMEEASEQAEVLAQRTPGGGNSQMHTDELRRQIFTGIKAAEKLAAHPDAGDQRKQSARQTKLTLLRLGVRKRLMLDNRLEAYVDELVEDDPQSEAAALAAACLLELRCFSNGRPKDEVLPLLVGYTEDFPDSLIGIALFRKYAHERLTSKDLAGAIECYRMGLSLYGRGADTADLERQLNELQTVEAKLTAGRARRQAAVQAKLASLKRQLGGYDDGFFVVYAEENVKPPRHGGFYWYHYEYEILEGLNAAAVYGENLPEKWSWELVQRFPHTNEGRKDAHELWKKLLKEKRTGSKKK